MAKRKNPLDISSEAVDDANEEMMSALGRSQFNESMARTHRETSRRAEQRVEDRIKAEKKVKHKPKKPETSTTFPPPRKPKVYDKEHVKRRRAAEHRRKKK